MQPEAQLLLLKMGWPVTVDAMIPLHPISLPQSNVSFSSFRLSDTEIPSPNLNGNCLDLQIAHRRKVPVYFPKQALKGEKASAFQDVSCLCASELSSEYHLS